VFAAPEQIASHYELLERMEQARARTDELFAIVRPDSLYARPIPERHRIIFYIGHLEAFDWNLFRSHLLSIESFDPGLDRLFAFGIDPVGGGLPDDQPSDWPALSAVKHYCRRIREALDAHLADSLGNSAATQLLHVAIEHRLMHAETLAYMLHQLPIDQKFPRHSQPRKQVVPPTPGMIAIPAGSATLGLERSSETFGWDNEYEAHSVHVPAFAIDRYKVTNAEFLKFVNAGGYEDQSFWTSGDWPWITAQKIAHPIFWKHAKNGWLLRTMFDEIPLPPDWPVYVSHAEASAYARWAGKTLPSETQWHRAAFGTPTGEERLYPWGNAAPNSALGNFDFSRWDPAPVNAFPQGASAFGVHDMLGNGWEWTSTVFAPFQGFQSFPFYPGYSANFFDGQHFVMKGGSPRTAACMLRRSFRNWFQPHYQYVYAGFRCVSPS
jgi:iron(II)-dependent oxidoreductase